MDTVPHSLSLNESAWTNLTSRRSRFRLSGPDRIRFLNGQITNNVALDLRRKSLPACLCSLKGKVEALVWVTENDAGDAVLIDGERAQREQIFQRLDRYLIADDCELKDVTDEWKLAHHFGQTENGTGRRAANRMGIEGQDIWAHSSDDPDWSEEDELSADDREKLEVLSALPAWGFEMTGNEFPSELRLDEWAVDFHKGCYLGQEIVSRIESVGQTKRNLFLLETREPLGKDEKVVVSGKQIGVTTRNSVFFGGPVYLTPALLATDQAESVTLDSEDHGRRIFLPHRHGSHDP